MRALKIILIVVLVLIILVIVGGIVFIKTFDINRYKPQIIAAAKSSLGRDFDIGTMELQASLKDGIRLDVHQVKIGEHPSFGKGDFVTIDEASVGVDVLAYLLKKQISIAKLSVKSPTVNLILAADGSMNAQTLGTETTTPIPEEEPDLSQPSKPAANPAALPAIFINELEVSGATVNLTDQSKKPPLKLAVKNIALSLNGFSFGRPFGFSGSAAVFGEKQNLQLEGRAQFDPKTNAVNISHLKSSIDLDSLPLAELRQLPYVPANVPFPKELGGQFSVTIKDLSAGAEGLTSILMDAALANGKMVIDEVAPGLSVAADQINFGLTDFSLGDKPFRWNFSAAYLNRSPNLFGQGVASLDMLKQAVTLKDTSFSTDFAKFPMDKLKAALPQLKDVPLPEKLAGKLSVTVREFAGSAKGIDALQADVRLTGGEVSMKDAAPGVNVAAKAIDATISNFSVTEPFTFSIKAAYLNDTPNIAVEGKGHFNFGNQNIRLNETKFTTDLSKFSFAQLKESVASLKDVPLPDEAAGLMTIDIADVIAGPQGLALLLADVNLSEGKIVMKNAAPGVSVAASQIQFKIDDFSLSEPFAFSGKLAAYSDLPNIAFNGKGTFDMKTQQVGVTDLNVQSELSSFSLDALRQSMASLKDAPLPQSIKGKFSVAIPTLATGPQGLTGLTGTIGLSDGEIALKDLPTVLNKINAKILMTNEAIQLPKVELNIGQGQLTVEGSMANYMAGTPDINFGTIIKNLNIAELVDQKDAPVKMEGLVSGNLKIAGKVADPKLPMNALKGDGSFTVTKGKLTDINILRMVLEKMDFIPNLRETVEANLPERFKAKLEQKDTILTAVTMDVGMDKGRAFVQPLHVEADGFLFEGNGQAGLADQSYDFDGQFIIPADLAAAMVKGVPQLELLFDVEKQIRFPLKVTGVGGKVSVQPDMSYITTNVMKNKGRQELQKVLDKALGVEKAPQPAPGKTPAPGGKTQPAPQQQSPEEILIEGVLDQIFK